MAKTRPTYYGMNVRKRKDGTIISTDSGVTVPKGPAKASQGTYSATNTTGNARANLKYRPVVTAKGVLHDYPGTKNDVVVKKPKTATASRSLHTEPPVTDANSHATPSGNAGYGIYNKKPRKKRGPRKLPPVRSAARGRPGTTHDEIGYV